MNSRIIPYKMIQGIVSAYKKCTIASNQKLCTQINIGKKRHTNCKFCEDRENSKDHRTSEKVLTISDQYDLKDFSSNGKYSPNQKKKKRI